ncbi:MAG: PilT/PilU family type 4a pilus ATPase [Candidatus Gastranaerophilales bacterium]|nr:PilT/PilU family type 4a pilus ATPase [Candidatus Gastranaerophilales bacterium]
MFDVNQFFKKAASIEASDIHLHVGEVPLIRKNGIIMKTAMPPLTYEDIENIFKMVVPEKLKDTFETAMDMDFVYEIPNVSRFRVNFNKQLNKPSLVIRIVPLYIRNFEELCLPETIKSLLTAQNGIVLVTGPTGCGKSTTLAAIINWLNLNFAKHILTIEDPVEYVFVSQKSVISQRQVSIDTASFSDGLKYALRQDPDVILIGEIRDRATAEAAVKAAETGHLVFATLHTNDAVQTINRIINMFDKNDRDYVKIQIAEVLRGTIAQKLVFSKEHNKRFPALEIMPMTATVKDYIKKDNIESIYQLFASNPVDMLSMNQSLFNLAIDGKLSQAEAIANSNSPDDLARTFRTFCYTNKTESLYQPELSRLSTRGFNPPALNDSSKQASGSSNSPHRDKVKRKKSN